MRDRDRFNANQLRDDLFAAADWTCVVCGRPLREGTPQLAHRSIASKGHLEEWGQTVIHHPINMVPVCSLACNSAVIIHGLGLGKLMQRIVRVTTGGEREPNMREEYAELRREFEEKRK